MLFCPPARCLGMLILVALSSLACRGGPSKKTAASALEPAAPPAATAAMEVAPTAVLLRNNWRCTAAQVGGDIVLQTSQGGIDQFAYRIGSSGALVGLRDLVANRELLAPPLNAENETDRVVQWTLWNMTPKTGAINAAAAASQDGRFNLTQAGRDDGLNAATLSAFILPGSCTVEIYGLQSDNWSAHNRGHLTGQIAALTRYHIGDTGQLEIQRLLQIGDAYVDGAATPLRAAYLEAWTPLDATQFRNVVLDWDTAGSPTWTFATGVDVPTYPALDTNKTRGVAIAAGGLTGQSLGLAVIFGQHAPCWLDPSGQCTRPAGTQALLNMQDFSRGSDTPARAALCLLPALYLGDTLPANTVIDTHLTLLPLRQWATTLPNSVAALAAAMPASRILPPGAPIPDDLTNDVAMLEHHFSKSTNVVRTAHVGVLDMAIARGSDHSQCLNLVANPGAATAELSFVTCAANSASNWRFEADGTVRRAELCLDTTAGEATEGSALQAAPCRVGQSQTWQRLGDALRARNTNLCVASTETPEGRRKLNLQRCQDSTEQQFYFGN